MTGPRARTLAGVSWATAAETLRVAATSAALSEPVARSIVAPGLEFARDCRMIAVALESVTTAPAPGGQLPGGGCVRVPLVNLRVYFAADGVPVPGDSGNPPSAEAITEWSLRFLRDAEAVWNKVADAIESGAIGPCDSATLGDAVPSGPSGGMSVLYVPLTLLAP